MICLSDQRLFGFVPKYHFRLINVMLMALTLQKLTLFHHALGLLKSSGLGTFLTLMLIDLLITSFLLYLIVLHRL